MKKYERRTSVSDRSQVSLPSRLVLLDVISILLYSFTAFFVILSQALEEDFMMENEFRSKITLQDFHERSGVVEKKFGDFVLATKSLQEIIKKISYDDFLIFIGYAPESGQALWNEYQYRLKSENVPSSYSFLNYIQEIITRGKVSEAGVVI